MSALTHGRAVALSLVLIGGALVARSAIEHDPAPATTLEPHPLIATASTWAPDRRCYVLWSDAATLEPADDGWFYAWLEPGTGWTKNATRQQCPAEVLAMARPFDEARP